MRLIFPIRSISAAGCILFLSACGPNIPQYVAEEKAPAVYRIAFRQLPPDPVYNRIKKVRPPDVMPSLEPPESEASSIAPLIHLHLKNSTLQQAAVALASVGNYESYCASSIQDRRISLDSVGTLDQLASQIANKAGVHVVVDHHNRQVRIVKEKVVETPVEPQFAAPEA